MKTIWSRRETPLKGQQPRCVALDVHVRTGQRAFCAGVSLAITCLALALIGSPAAAQGQAETSATVRLTVPPQTDNNVPPTEGRPQNSQQDPVADPWLKDSPRQTVDLLTDFERHVLRSVGKEVRRFGLDLLKPGPARDPLNLAEGSSQIPADYVLSVGDEVVLSLWGSVEGDLRLTVDRSGRITIPRVGPVLVAGIRFSELNGVIDQRVGQVFRNYRLSATLGKLRSIRVYVTGFTNKPGAYAVSSLATVVNAMLQAGGPSASGSFRNVEVRRGGKLLTRFDLYDLLVRGDKSGDRVLQAEDVVHIGPVGPQVALVGSVNRAAIFELKPGEVLEDVLDMGGGLSTGADRSRIALETLEARTGVRIVEVPLPDKKRQPLMGGEIVRAFSALEAAIPQQRQNKRVVVEGEVNRPGELILPPTATLADAIKAAGGLTSTAFVFGAELNRESVRQTQQAQYDRALRDLETEFARLQVVQKPSGAEESAALSSRAQSSTRLIERLRAVRPTGRIVLQLAPNAATLPDLPVEDGDRLLVPPRPTTVGVFGSVFSAGSFLLRDGASLDDIMRLAGGPTRGADASSAFVIRANGSVVSAKQQSSGWLTLGSAFSALPALPGDTIFVPEDLNRTTFVQEAKEWTQILYQFGLGAAALKTLKN